MNKALPLLGIALLLSACGPTKTSDSTLTSESLFTLNLEASEGGTLKTYKDGVEVSGENAASLLSIGDTLAILAEPNEGYRLASLTHNSEEVELSNGVGTIVIKEGNNLIEGTFALIPTKDSDFSFSEPHNGEVSVVRYFPTGEAPSPLLIPSEVTISGSTYKVTGIAERAFDGTEITAIRIGSNIKTLDPLAFEGARKLRRFEVAEGNSLYQAKDGILYQGKTLVRVPLAYGREAVVAEGTTHIADHAVSNVTSLETVTLPEGLQTIGVNAFRFDSDLKTVSFPSTLKSIGQGAFQFANSLKQIALPEGLTELGASAFASSGLEKAVVPGSLSALPDSAFYFCRNLADVTLNEGLKSIGSQAFISTKIRDFEAPSTLESIGSSAFELCPGLTTVKLNEGLLSIGDVAFGRSYSIQGLHLPSTLMEIGKNPFSGITSLGYENNFTIEDGCEAFTIEDSVLYGLKDNEKHLITYPMGKVDETYVLPEGVTHLDPEAFTYHREIEDLTLPLSLKSIDRAFYNMYTDLPGGITKSLTLRYAGTIEQFEAVDLHRENGGFHENTQIKGNVVTCIDGDYDI